METTADNGVRTDEALVHDARGESSSSGIAAAELFKRYEPCVKAISANYFVPGGDEDDVAQEARLGLFKAILNYDPARSDKFRPFALMCIRQQILTAMKTASRKKNMPLNSYISLDKQDEDNDGEGSLHISEKNNPESIFIDREKRETMDYMINKSLTSSEREILGSYLKGYTYKEIAAAVGKKTKAVDNAIQNIKRKLRMTMSDKG